MLFQEIKQPKKKQGRLNQIFFVLSSFLLTFSGHSFGEIVIGVVGKTKNDSFYQQSFKGCLKFAELHNEVRCIYDGPRDYQDIRTQSLVINELVQKGVDGLLISTTDSTFLVNKALKSIRKSNIPVITFDSDLLPEHKQYRLAYVGTDNFNFGKALGTYIKQFGNDELNSICLQSGHRTAPNLNARIAGVRYALSGQSTERMSGQHGWTEYDRCPLYSLGKRDVAVHQLETILKKDKPPVFLTVAGFAQFSPNYIEHAMKFKKGIESGDLVIVSADTEDIQLQALKQGLSVANIGQKPFEMGRLATELLYNYITKKQKPAKSNYYLDYHYCTQKNADHCTVNH